MAKSKKIAPAPELVSEHGQSKPTPKAPPKGTVPPPGTSGTWDPYANLPVAATPGTAAIPAYTPDYQALIQGDPLYMQQAGDLSAQGVQDAATRKANTDRALIEFGEVPDLTGSINGLGLDPKSPMYQMLFGDVDEMTRQGAADLTKAGLSTTAKIDTAHKTALQSLLDTLAARGTYYSGATNVGTGLENQNHLGAQFDARNNLLTYLAGVQSAFSEGERGRQSQLATDAGDATTRQIALHPATAAVPGTPPADAQGNPITFATGPDDRPGSSGAVSSVPGPPPLGTPPPTIPQKAYNKLNMGSFTA